MKREKGAATVEAIISFTGFLLVIFTFLNITNYCRAQMIISNAVDAAAKELSEYSYFYKMSGLQKLNDNINDNTKAANDNVNAVVGGLSETYSILTDAIGNSTELASNAKSAFDTKDLSAAESLYTNVKDNYSQYKTSYNTMYETLEPVADNPMLYIKSIAASAAGGAYDLLKSRLIAAPLAKALTKSHLSHKGMSADEYLRSLGVVDGINGLNFGLSTIFTVDEPDSIHLVCYYRLSLMQFMDLNIESPILCKESITRAWLGGDDVQVELEEKTTTPEKSTPETQPETPSEEQPEKLPEEQHAEEPENPSEEEKDPYKELEEALALYEKGQNQDKETLINIVKEVNAAGGVDYADAETLYFWAQEYDVSFDSLVVNTKDGKVWNASQFREKYSYSGITQYEYDSVLSQAKGSRPSVESYANQEYIDQHLAKFSGGGSFILTESQYKAYIESSGIIGRDDNTQFIMPSSECNRIMDVCTTNEEVAKALGIDLKAGEKLIRIDITGLDEFHLRMATGNEAGANDEWIPGGYTSGGTSEAVIDQILADDPKVTITELK